ncbi:MAG: helix-turn-helix domain-containing protein [Alphaproteobacteria bacterium]|nr:helix-turn-helix domain-containing protein [Alphaproteobacteria bacterium]
MTKIVFDSATLPSHLDDAAKFRIWHELLSDLTCSFELSRPEDKRLSLLFECAPFGDVQVGMFRGTLTGVERTRQAIAIDGSEAYSLGVNLAPTDLVISQNGRELVLGPGCFVLFSHFEAWKWNGPADAAFITWNTSRAKLAELVADPESLIATPLDGQSEAFRHLRNYTGFLLGSDPVVENGQIADLIGSTLLNLMTLGIGSEGDAAEVARMHGLRAARLREILSKIRQRFADPAFSSEEVAGSLGLSQRYINDLLHETGSSLAERVLELRLQKARAMLADRRHHQLKVSEIAYACGFNEVSYFNRCFRRRFGATPTTARNGQQAV